MPRPTGELRRCHCPVCDSRDVWKWGRPTLKDRLMQNLLRSQSADLPAVWAQVPSQSRVRPNKLTWLKTLLI